MEQTTAKRFVRPLLVVLGAVVVLAIVGVVVILATAGSRREAVAFAAERACVHGPFMPGVTPESHGGSFKFPYGAVRSCRVIATESRLFNGDVDASNYLFLDTEQGAVLVRVDFRNIKAGRQYTATAVELQPEAAPPGLTTDDVTRLRADIAKRGGLRTESWTLHYGDG